MALAPLLCAGLIGWRSLRIAGKGKKVGLYGFGASAHIIAQVAAGQGRSVYAFTRPGDIATQKFALHLGAKWAGGSDEMPPEPLDAAIIFAVLCSTRHQYQIAGGDGIPIMPGCPKLPCTNYAWPAPGPLSG